MRKPLTLLFIVLSLLSVSSCLIQEDPKPTYSELQVSRGDIIVVSFTADSVLSFNPDGTLKKVLYQLPNTADSITGLAFSGATNELLMAIDGTVDRIDALDVVDGSVRVFYLNATYFTGTPLGIAVLPDSGDIIASEGATIERFSSGGVRETWTTIWPTNVHASSQQLVGLSNGNWLSCSSTAGLRITPDSTTDLTAVATAVSGIAATTTSYGCGELSDGTIIVSWNGTSDAIQSYDSSISSATTIIQNAAVFSDPRGVAIGPNDEIYVTDATRNMVVEINTDGDVIRQFGNSYLQSPRAILVIPAFN